MAVDRANIIPICSYRKGKGLFSYENKPLITPFGGDKRDRTADLLNAIQALSQLSYTPVGDTLLFNCKGLQVLQVLKRGGWLNMTRAPS